MASVRGVKARFIAPNATLLGEKLEIGEGTWIGFYCLLDGQVETLTIGRHCDLASGSQFYTHSTHLRCVGLGGKVVGPVSIGDNVFIGSGSIILPNTKIGHHSIVGALSVVKGEFPAYSLIAGTPARLRKKLPARTRENLRGTSPPSRLPLSR